jgi:hypothetical protein
MSERRFEQVFCKLFPIYPNTRIVKREELD